MGVLRLLIFGLFWPVFVYAEDFFGGLERSSDQPMRGAAAKVAEACKQIPRGSEESKRLEDLANPHTLKDARDLQARLSEIRSIFAKNKDHRGTFTTIYDVITTAALKSVKAGIYKDNKMVESLMLEFGRLYLQGLFAHLKGGTISEGWKKYYDLAADCNQHVLKIMGTGVNVHVNIDLTQALLKIGAKENFYADFIKAGEDLLGQIPNLKTALKQDFNVDEKLTDAMLNAFLAGQTFNSLAGDQATSKAMFQSLRIIAFKFAMTINGLRTAKILPETRRNVTYGAQRELWSKAQFALESYVATALIDGPEKAWEQAKKSMLGPIGDAWQGLKDLASKLNPF